MKNFKKAYILSLTLLILKTIFAFLFMVGIGCFIYQILPLTHSVWTEDMFLFAISQMFVFISTTFFVYTKLECLEKYIYDNTPEDVDYYTQAQLVFGHPIQAKKHYIEMRK